MKSKLPLTADPNQIFTVTIPGDGKNITIDFTMSYNLQAKYWYMSLADHATGTVYVTNIALLPGVNLLGQYQYLNIGSAWIENVSDSSIEVPDDTTITNFILVWEL